jgi:hypothetical protein
MQEKVREILETIKRSAEIIRERQASSEFKDLIMMVGVANIIAWAEEAIKELNEERKEIPRG